MFLSSTLSGQLKFSNDHICPHYYLDNLHSVKGLPYMILRWGYGKWGRVGIFIFKSVLNMKIIFMILYKSYDLFSWHVQNMRSEFFYFQVKSWYPFFQLLQDQNIESILESNGGLLWPNDHIIIHIVLLYCDVLYCSNFLLFYYQCGKRPLMANY